MRLVSIVGKRTVNSISKQDKLGHFHKKQSDSAHQAYVHMQIVGVKLKAVLEQFVSTKLMPMEGIESRIFPQNVEKHDKQLVVS